MRSCGWLATDFEGGRHQRRLDQIADLEGKLRDRHALAHHPRQGAVRPDRPGRPAEHDDQLIASENFASPDVLEATGSVLATSTPRATPASGTTAATT